MLVAKLLLAGYLTIPVVGYPDIGQTQHLTDHSKVVALDIAEDLLAQCVAHNVVESGTMSYTDAIVDALQHSCRAHMQTAANLIEHYFDAAKGNTAFELLLDELPSKVRFYLDDKTYKGFSGL